MNRKLARSLYCWEIKFQQKVTRASLEKGTNVNVNVLGDKATVSIREGDWEGWFFKISAANINFYTEET